MARILVLYGTTDGHTRKIAERLGGALRDAGCAAEVVEARRAGTAVIPDYYDGVMVAASIHAGGYQRAVRRWVQWHAAGLNDRPSAFVSVCLGVLEQRPEAQRAVREILERFLQRAGWRPEVTQTVAGALPYTRYNWFKKWALRRMAAKAGMQTDTSRDYEFTDWGQVRALAQDFAARVRRPAPVVPVEASACALPMAEDDRAVPV